MIKFYSTRSKYGCFSNFYKSPVNIFCNTWMTVEHAYQAQKTHISEEYASVLKANSPKIARDLGQKIKLRPDWDEVKYSIMKQCVFAKFSQNEELKEILLSTGDEEIAEDSPVDYYWGIGREGTGYNAMGKILMEVRSELKGE